MSRAAQEVELRFSLVDPGKAKDFAANRVKLEADMKALQTRIKEKLKSFNGQGFYQYHKDFSYFFSVYGLKNLGSIEEIPGVSPSAARLGAVAMEAKRNQAVLALGAEHDPKAPLAKFSELSGVPTVIAPSSLQNPEAPDAYDKWQEKIADSILQHGK